MLVTPIATGSVTLQSLINVLGGFSSLGYTVFGYNDGAGMPDATTQADIDALIALGIPENRIAWVELGTLNAFTIAGIASASSVENVALSQAGGTFIIAGASSASDIENIIITSEGVSVFTIQDLESVSEIENVTITSIGQFIVAAVASASAIENVVMTQHGGTFAVANSASASGLDNVIITEGGVAGYFAETSEGWTLSNLTLSNGANKSGSAGTYGSVYGTAEGDVDGEEADASGFLEMTRDHSFVNGQVFSVWYKLTAGETISFVNVADIGAGVSITADNTWRQATHTWASGASPGDTLKVLAGSAVGVGNFVTGYLDDFTITGP
jgi:hypothetical protein